MTASEERRTVIHRKGADWNRSPSQRTLHAMTETEPTMNRLEIPQLIPGCPDERRPYKVHVRTLDGSPKPRGGTMTTVYVDRCGRWWDKQGRQITRLVGGLEPWTQPASRWRASYATDSGGCEHIEFGVVESIIRSVFWAFGSPPLSTQEERDQLLFDWIAVVKHNDLIAPAA